VKLFQYAVIYHPSDDEKKKGAKDKIVVDLTTILAEDERVVGMRVAREIPAEYEDKLSRLEVAVRPF
jgi:hypothetical protein